MKLGIMGLGDIAQKMAQTVNQMKDVELWGVAARDVSRAENFARRFGAKKAYEGYEALAEDKDVDLIYIATPHSFHYENAKMCIEHGKPCLVEKAFTVNASEARDLIKLAEEKHVFISEAMWVRFMPMVTKLKEILSTDPIGEIVALTANLGYEMTGKERLVEPVLAGGALLDVGIYPITFATLVLGYDISYLSTAVVKLASGVDAQSNVTFTYSNGAIADLYSTMLSETDKRGMIYGTKGRIEVTNINTYDRIVVMDLKGNVIKVCEAPPRISGYEYEVEACRKALQEGKLECRAIPHDLTIHMMEIMDGIRQQWGLVYPGEEQS